VLAALAIASLVAIGLGSLLSFGAELRSRSTEGTNIQAAVLELSALSALIEEAPLLGISSISDAGFELRGLGRGTEPDVSLRLGVLERAVTLVSVGAGNADGPSASVDLTPFEGISIEYLTASASGPRWVGASSAVNTPVRAARLVVQARQRTWPFVLWLEPLEVTR
jgi:hypothetical protein